MNTSTLSHPLDRIARRLPPPRLVALPLRLCPPPIRRQAMTRALNQVFREMLEAGDFDFLEGRSLAVEISDMDLRWVITAEAQRLTTLADDERADSSIRGRAVEFLLLAARMEDPDTLFFQRRLEVSGDTTIGLTTRNLLDRLPFEELPLALRILLNRAGRFAWRVRAARNSPAETVPKD